MSMAYETNFANCNILSVFASTIKSFNILSTIMGDGVIWESIIVLSQFGILGISG